MTKDYYKILGIEWTEDLNLIRKAYRQQALLHHPDKNVSNPASQDTFQQISEAYLVLSDVQTKKAYDTRRKRAKNGQEQAEREQATREWQDQQRRMKRRQSLIRFRSFVAKYAPEELELAEFDIDACNSGGSDEFSMRALSIRWAKECEMTNESIEETLKPYGNIQTVILLSKRPNSALVLFEDHKAVVQALSDKWTRQMGFSVAIAQRVESCVPKPPEPSDDLASLEQYEAYTFRRLGTG